MDYGYQLLRHVVQQVFGNIGPAARLTLVLFLAPFVGLLLLTGGVGFAGVGAGTALGMLVLVVFSIFAYCWAAVGWHRYVLLEETGNGIVPQWRSGNVMSYLGRAFIVGLVVVGAAIFASIVVALLVDVTGSLAIAFVLGIGLIFGLTWLATRIGLILPAAALGEKMTIGESWQATKPVSGHILLPLVVIALVSGLLGQLIAAMFGTTTTVEIFGATQEQVVLTLPGQILSAVMSWLQILVNLALMTTLYGNLIEGRQLN